jgi:hypothetical protein
VSSYPDDQVPSRPALGKNPRAKPTEFENKFGTRDYDRAVELWGHYSFSAIVPGLGPVPSGTPGTVYKGPLK